MDYEKLRLEKIQRNQEILKLLDIKKSIIKQEPRPVVARRLRPKSAVKKEKASPEPVRRSLRNQGIKAGHVGLDNDLVPTNYDTVVTKNKRSEPNENVREMVLGCLLTEDLGFQGSIGDVENVESKDRFFDGISKAIASPSLAKQALAKPKSRNCEALNVLAEDVAKIVDARIYSMGFVSVSKAIVLAGAATGALGIWDYDRESASEKICAIALQPHSRPITNIISPLDSPGNVYTSSYDGFLRCTDLEAQKTTDILCSDEYGWGNVSSKSGISFTGFDFMSSGSEIIATDSYGRLLFHDIRTPPPQQQRPWVADILDGKKIHSVSAHPQDGYTFATCDRNNTISLFDIRQRSKSGLKSLHSYQCSRVQSCVKFSPCGSFLTTIGFDDLIHVFSEFMGKGFDRAKHCGIPHDNQTGRWLTPFKICFDPLEPSSIIVGSLRRTLQHFTKIDSRDSLGYTLGWERGGYDHEAVTANMTINAAHPFRNLIASGVASGRAYLWHEVNP